MKAILDLIGNDQLEEAIKILLEKSIKIDDIQKELILLQARLADINRDFRKGIIKEEDENLQKNQIRNALIELTFNLKKKVHKQTSRKKILDITFSFSLVFNIAITINFIICKCDCKQNEEKFDAIAKFILRDADDLFKRKHCNYAYTKYTFVLDTIWQGENRNNLQSKIEECITCAKYIKNINSEIDSADSLIKEKEYKYAVNKYSKVINFNDKKLNCEYISKTVERKLKGLLNIIDSLIIGIYKNPYVSDNSENISKQESLNSTFDVNNPNSKFKIHIIGSVNSVNHNANLLPTYKKKKLLELNELKNEINVLLDRIEMN